MPHQLSRLIYASERNQAAPLGVSDLLSISRKRNMEAAVTGFLFYDGQRFVQVLEGGRADVSETYHRIVRDPRHRNIVLLSCREIPTRQFGYWSMGLHEGMDDATRIYLLETFALREDDLGNLSGDNMLQFLSRLARITRQLDEMNAMLALKS